MLLVVALFGLIGGIGIPTYNILTRKDELRIAEEILMQALRRAEVLASVGAGDSAWGVMFLSGELVLYKGASYVARDVSFDEMYALNPTFVASGVTEVVFAKSSGTPSVSGSISIQNTVGDSVQISINEKGMVDF